MKLANSRPPALRHAVRRTACRHLAHQEILNGGLSESQFQTLRTEPDGKPWLHLLNPPPQQPPDPNLSGGGAHYGDGGYRTRRRIPEFRTGHLYRRYAFDGLIIMYISNSLPSTNAQGLTHVSGVDLVFARIFAIYSRVDCHALWTPTSS
jgi:hypothetical protein